MVWDGGLEVEIRGFREILSSFCVGSAFCYRSLGFCARKDTAAPKVRASWGRPAKRTRTVDIWAGHCWIWMDWDGISVDFATQIQFERRLPSDCSSRQIHGFNFLMDE